MVTCCFGDDGRRYQHSGHGRAGHHRHGAGGGDADGGRVGHRRRGRPGERRLQLQVAGRRRGHSRRATDSTYTPVVDDAGRAIGVRVSFTDDRGFEESLTGAAGTVPADDYTVNEVWETGNWGWVTVGGSATGVVEKPGDRDFFGVNLSQGGTYRIDVAGHGDVGALEQVRLYGVFVYAEDLECSGAYDDPGVTTYVLTAEHSAPHSVAVRAEGDGTGVYRVSVSESDDTGTGCDTAPVAAAQAANTPATGAPAITGTVRVGETLTADTSVIADVDGLDNAAFAYQWLADGADISGATDSTYTLGDSDMGKAISVTVSFTDDAGNAETLTSAATDAVEAKANTPATGQPTISGTAKVGETLTADTSAIADADGLDNAVFSYQWLADGTDISGSTGSTYTLADADEGKAISVKVSFTDGAGHAETLTSAATDVVEAKPNNPATGAPAIRGTAQVGETLTSDTSGISDADGLANASFSYQWRADGADISGATDVTYALADSDEGKTVKVRVSFTDDAGNDETLTSAATDAVEARPNRPATGALVITGAARVGELLTADTSGIADDDGLDKTSFSYQWQADGADIPGATNENYTLTDSDKDKAISVTVSFTDEAGHEESFTSAATAAVVAAAEEDEEPTDRPHGLTAEASQDGIILTWKAPEGYGSDYRILRNRPELGEAEPLVYVAYTDTTDVTYTDTDVEPGVLYVYSVTALDFLGDAGEASRPVEIRMQATSQQQTANSPATGAPAITGTAQVGQTLTADTSGIADDDGLSNAVFSYQWQAGGADISSATGSSYTLVDSDEGKAVSVTVSFTDDTGNAETLTSAATTAVEAIPNSPATGAPAIGGTAQVGETLTTDTSGVADGLSNASFSYQWQAGGADISGATGSTYTLADADEGKAISVAVSFTDDAGNAETLTSAATDGVDGASSTPLTASVENVAASHDGESVFTFELRFSEEFGISYKTLRDHAFTVTGGTVKKAQRLEQGSNIGWRITVSPDSSGAVTITLPITEDCDAQGAICTEDGRMLSHRLELTVSGP